MIGRGAGAERRKEEQGGRICKGEVRRETGNAGQVLWLRFVKGPCRRN